MNLRPIACALALVSLASCNLPAPYKKKDDEDKKPLQDQSKDPSFQSFLGRLRIAVSKHDTQTLSTLMTPDFGYRWDDAPPGENAFMYWDQHKLWGELSHILQQKFVPSDMYMVAPAEVVSDSNYTGFRVGARTIRGSWHLAYFVSGEGAR